MKNLIYHIILIFVVISCSYNDETNVYNSDLVGKWNWIDTHGGEAFHIHESPESTGKTFHLILNADYTYIIIENDIEISSGSYNLTFKKSIYSGEIERFITYSNDQYFQNVVITGIVNIYDSNELNISDNCYDGTGSGFERIE